MPETYNAVIAAIADESSKLNEIATKVGIESSQCSKTLSTLISLGLVRKEYPATEPKSKKTIYRLDDWMFIFWYRFVLPDISRINAGLGESVCDDLFTGQISYHAGMAFEDCAKQYMWRMLKKKSLPVSFRQLGRWWGSNPKERREEEIDFIAYAGDSAIFGECKWRNELTGESVLDDLMRKSGLFPAFKRKYYMLFSKSGFTEPLIKRAEHENARLIGVDDLFME